MDINYFDVHSHLNLDQFTDDWRDIVAKLASEKIGTFTVGVNNETSQKAVSMALEYANLWAIVGLHPAYVDDEDFDIVAYAELASRPKVVAIGECGFDFFHAEKTLDRVEKQTKIFTEQIKLAAKLDLPLMMHIRPSRGTYDAYDMAIAILQEYKTKYSNLRGDAHFFAGTIEQAQQFIELGFYVSFTGVVTFTRDYDKIIKSVPMDKILAETDAPYVAPAPYRGQRCEPKYVMHVYQRLAEIYEVSPQVLSRQIKRNVQSLFLLDEN